MKQLACVQVFDVAAVRAALQGRLHSLESELHQVRMPWLMRLIPCHRRMWRSIAELRLDAR